MNKKTLLTGIIWFLICKIASFLSLFLTFGSHTVIFSGFTLMAPVTGTFFTLPTSLLLVAGLLVSKCGVTMYAITFGIPTIIASLCWAIEFHPNKTALFLKTILHLAIPLICILFFIKHPVGKHAFLYSFYWFIPIILSFIKKNKYTLFRASFSINFITHAIGSILWLYTIPTTPTFWLALIPIVAIERILLSLATMGLVHSSRTILKHSLLRTKSSLTNIS